MAEHYGLGLTAGTFDPVTTGHLELIRRAAEMCDVLIVGIFENPDKTPYFPVQTRFEALCAATMDIGNVIAMVGEGMLSDYAREIGADVIIKGVRSEADRKYEQLQADYNFEHCGVKTVMLQASRGYEDISSSAVRALISSGGDFEKFIPLPAREFLIG